MQGPLQDEVYEATHPRLPHWRARELRHNPRADVRCALALNPSCPDDVLEFLSTDPSWIVRLELARRPHLPAVLEGTLAADSVAWVRTTVATNPTCSPPTLATLTEDEVESVRHAAAAALRAHPGHAEATGDHTASGKPLNEKEAAPATADSRQRWRQVVTGFSEETTVIAPVL